MSNKTPPLVIPVVVDASGVQQGLNNVNNRLRKGVAGGAAGSAGGGGFGSGGGDATSALAVGAAVGAFGRGGDGNGGGSPQSSFRARQNAAHAWWRDRTRGRRSYGPSWYASTGTLARDTFEAFDPISERMEAINAVHRTTVLAANAREVLRARATRRKFVRNVGRGVDAFAGGAANALGYVKEARGAMLGILGAAYTGKKIYDLANNIGAAGSDLSNLVGSTNYGKMRNVALREFDRGANPSPIQSMLLGGMKMTGGRETALEKDAAAIRKGVSSAFGAAGAFYEIIRNDPLAALRLWFLSGPGGVAYEMFGGSVKDTIKTEIAYRNMKAAGN